ncbi:MAG: tyrosine-type recombinase/integrase [Polyangiales bacterium]
MLRGFRAEVADGAIVASSELTPAMAGREWLDKREVRGSRARDRVRSIDGERSVWRRHVEPSDLAAMAVQSIRPRDVEDFAQWLRSREAVQAVRSGPKGVVLRRTGRPITRAMQREALRLVRAVLAEAVRDEIIPSNPAAHVKVARGGQTADLEDDWLRADEIDALLGCDEISLRDRTAYACAIGLALRLNDLKALRVAHVHLDEPVPGAHVRVWIAKSERWYRVPVMRWLDPWLRAHLKTLPEDAEWVFPAPDGERYGPSYNFNWPEKKQSGRPRRPSALERAGVDRRIRFHDLRGTCATHLALGTWGRRWSLYEIQQMLAHTDQRVTERYVRRAQDALAAAAAATPGGPSGAPLPTRRPREDSSARDQADSAATVNRLVAGSSPAPGASSSTARFSWPFVVWAGRSRGLCRNRRLSPPIQRLRATPPSA